MIDFAFKVGDGGGVSMAHCDVWIRFAILEGKRGRRTIIDCLKSSTFPMMQC